MTDYTMPYNLDRNDALYGTIVSTNRYGIHILLKIEDVAENVYAFAFCGGRVGQEVLVTVRKYNSDRNNFCATVDSFLTTGERPIAEEREYRGTAKAA